MIRRLLGRFEGTFIFVAALLVFALGISVALYSRQQTTDRGVQSSMALVALGNEGIVESSVTYGGIAPEGDIRGTITLWAGVGTEGESTEPRGDLNSRVDPADESPLSRSRQGVVLLVGGRAAEDFESCASPVSEWFVFGGIPYGSLTPAEKDAVVQSVTAQLQDREGQYGETPDEGFKSATDIASEMKFTLLEPKVLSPEQWSTVSRERLPEDRFGTARNGTTISVSGHSAFIQCDVSFQSLLEDEPWGKRFVIPALATAGSGPADRARAFSGISTLRLKELQGYRYSSTFGMDGSSSTESWAGVDGAWVSGASAIDATATSVIPDITMSFVSEDSSVRRDALIFLAGVILSIFATLCVSLVRHWIALALRRVRALDS